eukprot:scaffold22564_cov67-Phaeocystis_antarctica.AAC.5
MLFAPWYPPLTARAYRLPPDEVTWSWTALKYFACAMQTIQRALVAESGTPIWRLATAVTGAAPAPTIAFPPSFALTAVSKRASEPAPRWVGDDLSIDT